MRSTDKSISLRQKLLVRLLMPMLFLWLLNAAFAYYAAYKFADIAYDRSLADSASDLAERLVVAGDSLNLPKAAMEILLSDRVDTISYKVVNRDGKVIAGDSDLPLPDTSELTGNTIMHDGFLRGRRVRIASLYFVPKGEISRRPILIQVAETRHKRVVLAREILTTMVVPQLILIALAGLIVWYGIREGLAPLDQLRREITSRSHRDLSPIEESYTPMEVRPIIHSINGLLDRLANALEAQQRFIADAAHQLRTPLAGLKTQTELALRQNDPENMQSSLKMLITSADRVVRLINQMLAVAQVEPGAGRILDVKPLDLNELAREITMEWVPHALGKSVDLGYEGPHGVIMIEADKVRMKMLIDNLLDNAIRFSSRGGRVTLKVETTDNAVVLAVEDSGPGIPQEERESVFRRFYRVLGSPGEGSGLGLSIVKEIAIAHGATIILDEPEDHPGTLVKILLPKLHDLA